MKILVTGSKGFIGKNLISRLSEIENLTILSYEKEMGQDELHSKISDSDIIYHLAGKNRTDEINDFKKVNTELTKSICDLASKVASPPLIIFTSSIQAEIDSAYGKSKLEAEKYILEYSRRPRCNAIIYRLTNVFGKWCKPNYNSVIATFCNNLSKDLPIELHDPDKELDLIYIDDVIEELLSNLRQIDSDIYRKVEPTYTITLKEIANKLIGFKDSRKKLEIGYVGTGIDRALYATYISYLEPEQFNYKVPSHSDDRGTFVEVLKTQDSGQFSFFTAYPGITRGGHYHHTKNEKFLVLQGKALFRFKNLISGTYKEIVTSEQTPEIVDTIPGWTHDITNIGESKLIVMLWANEIFNQEKPDTYSLEIT